ncbi:MAG: hypothetical protein JWO85_1847 [Candidatus Eremiobacteraeota bacterium]|nr:hypothetical protein [Candidatus Eremiobacteraeota bacterium]
MRFRWLSFAGLALCAAGTAACNSSNASVPTVGPPTPGISTQQLVALPNLTPGGKFTYDIGIADAAARRYYLADRTNASLDIINLDTFAVRQVTGGFTGQKASNDNSGPDGVAFVPGGSVYVGDVNVVKVVDPVAGSVTATIPTGTAGFRTDEGCYDPDDKLIMFANPADSPPYATWISTTTNTVVAKLNFTGSVGLEQCVYDPGTKKFFINNDGTPANAHGELDAIVASAALAGAPTIAQAFPEGNCGPTGLALGPNENLLVGCDTPAGSQQMTLIMSATSGAVVKTITQVGGEDEVAYDPKLNHYYTASRDMTASGISQTGQTGAVFTPVLGVIDAATNTWIANLPTGSGAHSVAADSATGRVFVPVPPTATANGGVQLFGP